MVLFKSFFKLLFVQKSGLNKCGLAQIRSQIWRKDVVVYIFEANKNLGVFKWKTCTTVGGSVSLWISKQFQVRAKERSHDGMYNLK